MPRKSSIGSVGLRRKMKKASKTNPWLNFLRDYREKNGSNANYYKNQVQLMKDAGTIFKSMAKEEKDKFRVEGYKSPAVEKKLSTGQDEVSQSSSTEMKKGRGKKQQA